MLNQNKLLKQNIFCYGPSVPKPKTETVKKIKKIIQQKINKILFNQQQQLTATTTANRIEEKD